MKTPTFKEQVRITLIMLVVLFIANGQFLIWSGETAIAIDTLNSNPHGTDTLKLLIYFNSYLSCVLIGAIFVYYLSRVILWTYSK